MEQFIIHNGIRYDIKEPTIEMYSSIMKLKDLYDDEELYIKMICAVTDLTREEVLSADASTIKVVGDMIDRFINLDGKELFQHIEHKGVKYQLVDVYRMSFGQFVDIDTFLSKNESYRISNLNELAAYLYYEEDTKYGDTDFRNRTEAFKDLPLKYVEGAVFFLLNIGVALHQLTALYSKNKMVWAMMKMRIRLANIGVGIPQFLTSRKTLLGTLIALLLYPLYLVSTIWHTSWMLIRKKKKK